MMNKYTASALSAEAAAGKRVLVVSHSQRAAVDAFRDFQGIAHSLGAARVIRADGAEQIKFATGGFVTFASARSRRVRGKSVDIVFVDWDVETELSGTEREAFYADARPCVATSELHEIVRA